MIKEEEIFKRSFFWKKCFLILIVAFFLFFNLNFVLSASYFEFNGTIWDIDGTEKLNGTLINVTIVNESDFSVIGYNTTTSYTNITHGQGWFNASVYSCSDCMYKINIQHSNSTYDYVQYVGQNLPYFPVGEMSRLSATNFYLKEAGTINITTLNATLDLIDFTYMIKDLSTGSDVSSNWQNAAKEFIVYVPKNRNYSIMLYPNSSSNLAMNVKYEWKNFSETITTHADVYNLTSSNGLNHSDYNVTSSTLSLKLNNSLTSTRVYGHVNISGIDDNITGLDEFVIVPFILEPGNLISMERGAMPWNMSHLWGFWWGGLAGGVQQGDSFNLTNGSSPGVYGGPGTYNYNFTLPATGEGSDYLLFAIARNASTIYGSFRNITISSGDSAESLNFTMYGLFGSEVASTNGNITVQKFSAGFVDLNISGKKQKFNLVNSTNDTFTSLSAHIEAKVDYSNYGAIEFTFMEDISQDSGSSSFYLPLINTTGVKEINIYSMSYAPKRVSYKQSEIADTNNNILMASFNPGDIDGASLSSDISVALYKSNSTCDVPSPADACVVADSSNMDNFNPLSAVIGGGALSFRMGLSSSGIEVHYSNVDMLASGPPDCLFDDSTTNSTSGDFSSAMRFGSSGPSIYDFILISMPYTQGSTSTAGLNENNDVNASIPIFYDENWNVIWNASDANNGTGASSFSGNYTHYENNQYEWAVLLNNSNCTVDVDVFNATNPCYIDKTNNKIWLRLPHFSGTGPSITGVATSVTSSSSSSSSSGGGGTASFWSGVTKVLTSEQFSQGASKSLKKKDRVKIEVEENYHYVGVVSITETSAVINVSSIPQQAVFNIGDEKKFDVTEDGYYDLSVTLNSIENDEVDLTIVSVADEKIAEEKYSPENVTESDGGVKFIFGNFKIWIFVFVVVVVLIILFYVIKKLRKPSEKFYFSPLQKK